MESRALLLQMVERENVIEKYHCKEAERGEKDEKQKGLWEVCQLSVTPLVFG